MKHGTFLKTLILFAAIIAGSETMALGDNLAPVAVDDQFYVNRSDYFFTDVVACTGPVAATLNCAIGADTQAILVNGLYTGPASVEVACGCLSFYAANDLADGFDSSPIADTSVDFGADDPTFATAPTTGSVTQTATATLRSLSYKFFKASIHAEIVGNGEEP